MGNYLYSFFVLLPRKENEIKFLGISYHINGKNSSGKLNIKVLNKHINTSDEKKLYIDTVRDMSLFEEGPELLQVKEIMLNDAGMYRLTDSTLKIDDMYCFKNKSGLEPKIFCKEIHPGDEPRYLHFKDTYLQKLGNGKYCLIYHNVIELNRE